ncbi:fimbrial protein [Providencia rettgeri]|uniref:fimbrial protein n=1 Tax=Providencia rettgeri TaxID=587 RepID=UPI0023610A27|nr:fimbrial protein [Providencia rettgeri]
MKTKLALLIYSVCFLFSALGVSDDNQIEVTFKVTIQAGTCDIKMDDNKTDIAFEYVDKDAINSTTKDITLQTICTGIANNKRIQLNFSTNQYGIDPSIATNNYLLTSKDNLSIGFYDENDNEIPLNQMVNTQYDAKVSTNIPIVLKLQTNESQDIETGPFESSITIHANYY